MPWHASPRVVTLLDMREDRSWTLLFGCWLVVTAATLGSLFFSEVMELPPCALCWWQRLFMFPMPIVVGAGLFPFDRNVVRYALPLAAIGTAVAVYHTLLQWGVVPESAAPCQQGVSCTEAQLMLLGFLSIPMLATLAFGAAVALLFLVHRSARG
jgi:disulfide bond formation protein DsbB